PPSRLRTVDPQRKEKGCRGLQRHHHQGEERCIEECATKARVDDQIAVVPEADETRLPDVEEVGVGYAPPCRARQRPEDEEREEPKGREQEPDGRAAVGALPGGHCASSFPSRRSITAWICSSAARSRAATSAPRAISRRAAAKCCVRVA